MKKQLINLAPVKEDIKAKLLEKYDATTYMNTDTVNIKVDIKEILEKYIEEKNIKEPTVLITLEAYEKMRKLVDATATEIGWYGTVEQPDGLEAVYIINDILVYPQTVTGATCVQDEDKMFEFELSLTDDQVNHKRFHGHSHVNMCVTPSGVDENFYQDLLVQVKDYFIVMVTNKRKENTIRFYDIQNNILYTDVPIVLMTEDGNLIDNWYEEVMKNLTEHKPVSKYTPGQRTIWDEDYEILDDDKYNKGYYNNWWNKKKGKK